MDGEPPGRVSSSSSRMSFQQQLTEQQPTDKSKAGSATNLRQVNQSPGAIRRGFRVLRQAISRFFSFKSSNQSPPPLESHRIGADLATQPRMGPLTEKVNKRALKGWTGDSSTKSAQLDTRSIEGQSEAAGRQLDELREAEKSSLASMNEPLSFQAKKRSYAESKIPENLFAKTTDELGEDLDEVREKALESELSHLAYVAEETEEPRFSSVVSDDVKKSVNQIFVMGRSLSERASKGEKALLRPPVRYHNDHLTSDDHVFCERLAQIALSHVTVVENPSSQGNLPLNFMAMRQGIADEFKKALAGLGSGETEAQKKEIMEAKEKMKEALTQLYFNPNEQIKKAASKTMNSFAEVVLKQVSQMSSESIATSSSEQSAVSPRELLTKEMRRDLRRGLNKALMQATPSESDLKDLGVNKDSLKELTEKFTMHRKEFRIHKKQIVETYLAAVCEVIQEKAKKVEKLREELVRVEKEQASIIQEALTMLVQAEAQMYDKDGSPLENKDAKERINLAQERLAKAYDEVAKVQRKLNEEIQYTDAKKISQEAGAKLVESLNDKLNNQHSLRDLKSVFHRGKLDIEQKFLDEKRSGSVVAERRTSEGVPREEILTTRKFTRVPSVLSRKMSHSPDEVITRLQETIDQARLGNIKVGKFPGTVSSLHIPEDEGEYARLHAIVLATAIMGSQSSLEGADLEKYNSLRRQFKYDIGLGLKASGKDIAKKEEFKNMISELERSEEKKAPLVSGEVSVLDQLPLASERDHSPKSVASELKRILDESLSETSGKREMPVKVATLSITEEDKTFARDESEALAGLQIGSKDPKFLERKLREAIGLSLLAAKNDEDAKNEIKKAVSELKQELSEGVEFASAMKNLAEEMKLAKAAAKEMEATHPVKWTESMRYKISNRIEQDFLVPLNELSENRDAILKSVKEDLGDDSNISKTDRIQLAGKKKRELKEKKFTIAREKVEIIEGKRVVTIAEENIELEGALKEVISQAVDNVLTKKAKRLNELEEEISSAESKISELETSLAPQAEKHLEEVSKGEGENIKKEDIQKMVFQARQHLEKMQKELDQLKSIKMEDVYKASYEEASLLGGKSAAVMAIAIHMRRVVEREKALPLSDAAIARIKAAKKEGKAPDQQDLLIEGRAKYKINLSTIIMALGSAAPQKQTENRFGKTLTEKEQEIAQAAVRKEMEERNEAIRKQAEIIYRHLPIK